MDKGKFEVDDLVRVKVKEGVDPEFRLTVGPITSINFTYPRPYIVAIPRGPVAFAEDELEKI